ncbi:MAG: tRNA-dihydrouridine synthase family protein [Lachnospiraceae bacterium]|nr:tRNA-dihydrouridine synthase family protein [Lachnospiraceae bacterium]
MKYYLAPMEGITGYIYRSALKDHFGDNIDKFFTPFLVVHEKRALSNKEINEILPENNKGINLVPQILADDADGFLRIDNSLYEYGYREINLNLGCPSKTVASKGRGSGFLGRLSDLEYFLDKIFNNNMCNISIKTRMGEKSVDEFEELMRIFNKFPLKELIIHPRIRYEYYKGNPHRDVFYRYIVKSLNPVCYNGDVRSKRDVEELLKGCGNNLFAIMIGRGMISDPSLIRQLTGGEAFTKEELSVFLKRISDDYSSVFSGEAPVLQKMKELWSYMGSCFADKEPEVKKLLKCRSLKELKLYQMQILQ